MSITPRKNEMSATAVHVVGRHITLHLTSGRVIELPIGKFPRLSEATDEQLAAVKLRRMGEALRWADLDEDIQVSAVVAQRWPTHGGFRPGAGRKPGQNHATTARINQYLLKKVDKESRKYPFSKADIFNDALSLRDSVISSEGVYGQCKMTEVDLSSLASFKSLKDRGYTVLQIKPVKRSSSSASKVIA